MSTLVESLRRLYKAGRVTDAKLKSMVKKKQITQEEYEYIVAE